MHDERIHKEEMHEQETPSEQGVAQTDLSQPDPDQPLFALHPSSADFCVLAEHIAASPPEVLHSALWPQRVQVAQSLRQMGEEPEHAANQAAYHALRLLAW